MAVLLGVARSYLARAAQRGSEVGRGLGRDGSSDTYSYSDCPAAMLPGRPHRDPEGGGGGGGGALVWARQLQC
jgi:hypothetical protein